MKKLLFLALLLLPVLAHAQKLPWPEGMPCAQVAGLDHKDKYTDPITARALIGSVFAEIEAMIAQLQGKPSVEISFEYIQMRQGFQVMAQATYGDCKTFAEDDEEQTELRRKSNEGTLTADDFKGPRWLHMVQPIDSEEANCLALSKVNGVLGGCNDLWQDGVTEDETVCIKGKTYMKCHVDCMEKIYKRKIESQPGFCPVQE